MNLLFLVMIVSILIFLDPSRTGEKNDDNEDDDPNATPGQISPSPVIPVISNFRRRLSPETTEDTHREQEYEDENDNEANTSTSSKNRTLLANFENDDDEEEEEEEEEITRKRDKDTAADTSMVQDVDLPSDNDDYDFIPGTPPSKKVRNV